MQLSPLSQTHIHLVYVMYLLLRISRSYNKFSRHSNPIPHGPWPISSELSRNASLARAHARKSRCNWRAPFRRVVCKSACSCVRTDGCAFVSLFYALNMLMSLNKPTKIEVTACATTAACVNGSSNRVRVYELAAILCQLRNPFLPTDFARLRPNFDRTIERRVCAGLPNSPYRI
jgi:hypothetical protein